MEYNRARVSTFFYVFIWRHAVKWFTRATERITTEQKAEAAREMTKLVASDVTPEALALWYISKGFEYREDGFDDLKSPAAFYAKRAGDCDDFAEFAVHVLTATGWRCRRLYLRGSEGAHVVALADNGRDYFILDTYATYTVRDSAEACAYFVADGYDEYLLQ